MIRRLSYVSCDRCGGFPAQPGDDAKDARAIARAEGYTREKDGDICGRCNGTVDEGGWSVGEASLGPQPKNTPSGGQDTSDSLERQSEWGKDHVNWWFEGQ